MDGYTPSTVAAEGAAAFETATRPDGESFTRVKDGAPEWVREAVRAAHGSEFLPDDFRYAFASEAFDAIADAGEDADLDDVGAEFADNVEVYTSGLVDWVRSNLNRTGYVDQAAEDLGGESLSFASRLMLGQAVERREVFDAIRGAVERETEEREEEDEPRPDEDDAYLTPSGPLGARTSASFGGKHLGEFDSDDEALAAIRAAADAASFWPNCWTVSDHGNIAGPISYAAVDRFVVVEFTPGYLPDEDEPAEFDDYSAAVEYLNERAAEYADDPDASYRVEYGIASSDNLAAAVVHDDEKMHDLGRIIEIVRAESGQASAGLVLVLLGLAFLLPLVLLGSHLAEQVRPALGG
jgi:hypothetical protein